MKSVAIACGGTGGHISPGIALLEELLDRKSQYNVDSIIIHSPLRNKDNPDLQNLSVPVIWHNLPQWKKWNIFFYPFLLFKEITKTYIQFKKRKVDTVIGMGGYTSILAILYAKMTNSKYYLCEQNSAPGKITRIFWRGANKTAFSFPLEWTIPKDVNGRVVGNPLRKSVLPKIPGIKSKTFSKKDPINVLVLGGSQGARQINRMVLDALEEEEITSNFKFRMLTGTNLYEEVKTKTSQVEAISYSQDMRTHYEWADLVIGRSGAGVLAECSAYGLPLILIPYPYATDNHQMANAKYYKKNMACILLKTKSMEGNELIPILRDILISPSQLLDLSKASLSLAKINASKDTLDYFFHE